MSFLDPPPPGRHRARHAEAAPDAYVDDPRSDAWWRDRASSANDWSGEDSRGDAGYGHPDDDGVFGGDVPCRDEVPRDVRRRGGVPGRDGPGRGGLPREEFADVDWRFGADQDWRYGAKQERRYGGDQPAAPGGEALRRDRTAGSAYERPARQSRTARAGRNLPAAIGVGLVLGTAVIASLVLWRPAFLAVVIVAVAVATWEMGRAVRACGAHPPLTPLLVGALVMTGLAWYTGPAGLAIGLLLTVLATLVWRLADGPTGYHRDVAAATLIAVYVPFLGGFAVLLVAPDNGALRVLSMLIAVVCADTGGYVAGVRYGKRPLAPTVSPKKSWEGLAGGLLASAVASAIIVTFWFDAGWWWGIVFGLGVAVAAVLGDLAESMLKRDLGLKDMSRLLPGHGGLMDRLDSILFAAPAAYLLLSVFAPA